MKIDNLKLSAKALAPLVVMVVAVIAMASFGALKLTGVSGEAHEIIAQRDRAVVDLTRAASAMMMAPYSAFGALVYDGSSPEGRTAQADFSSQSDKVVSLLDAAAALAPKYGASLEDLKKRFQDLAEKAKQPLSIGEDLPGLVAVKDLKPDEQEKLGQGAQQIAGVDADARKLVANLNVIVDAMINENARAATDLTRQSTEALIAMAAAAAISTLVAGALTVWISQFKIARPLVRLTLRTKALADGNLSVEIGENARKDEIGEMARAVQILKDHAIARAELERAALAQRNESEAARENAAAERARISASQSQAVNLLGKALKALSDGDLTLTLADGFAAEYQQICTDFNEAVAKLKTTLLAVVSTSATIRVGAGEISRASSNFAQRTEQQAAHLEETATALEQITAAMKRSADGAVEAREVVAAADADAKASAEIVRRAVDAMSAISRSATEIGKIIVVIDEIAFQTNLLALNAGVEAARAGDAGRGFAVVASEVRALALRSAEAAKQIKQLISASTAEVGSGVKLVGDTGQSLSRIVSQVSKINRIVNEIATGANEQANSLVDINGAINQMDKTTQENSAMVQQSTDSAQALARETAKLANLVAQFKVGETRAEDPLRRELKKAAPHAFSEAAKAPASRAPSTASKAAPRTAPLRAVNAAALGKAEADWTEF